MFKHVANKFSIQRDLLYYSLSLTGFFLLVEISFFIQSNQAYLFDFSFISHHLTLPVTILPGILFFIVVQLGLHFIYSLVIWIIALFIFNLFSLSKRADFALVAGLWMLGLAIILVANQFYFPNSKFAELTSLLLFNSILEMGCFILLSILAIAVLILASISCFYYFIWPYWKRYSAAIVLITMLYVFKLPYSSNTSHTELLLTHSPHIILVGVDSLRPDFLGFFGYPQSTPFLDAFLRQSTVFSNAMTPLARTFPSWTSILTGEYPKQTGVRFNLAEQQTLNLQQTLAAILERHGYETVYATDETRFSNIDHRFGFQQIITPPMGVNDFLLGTFNDFPLSNLLINTVLGQWLFPYSYANRAANFVYDPNSFLRLLQPVIAKRHTQPLFLAVHFCLPHSPYHWADLHASQYDVLSRYHASILRVDKQLKDFFALLKANHLLDHAIVVLLSDHGEAFELPGDRITEKENFVPDPVQVTMPLFYPGASLEKDEVNRSAGHGTDVLGLSQYHTLLAFRLYGAGSFKQVTISDRVSLLSIKSTVLALAGLEKYQHPREKQRSLAAVIKGTPHVRLKTEPIFLESDFTPDAIRTVYPEVRKVVLEGVHLFQIDHDTTRLTTKPSMGKMIIKSKQYANIHGEWMLALYPQNEQERLPVLINLNTKRWTTNLYSDLAKQANAMHLLAELKAFYGEEIKIVRTEAKMIHKQKNQQQR